MGQRKKCKKVVRMLECKNYSEKIICKTLVEVNPTTISDSSIIPTINRYFYIPVSNTVLTNGVTIPSNLFYNDVGSQTTEFVIFNPNGYVNLYVNGVMQEGGLYMVNENALIINPTPGTIRAGTSIIVESLGFSSQLIL
ncbi:DUF4183 domain-containing protein [Sporosarcina sp. JAI121]|uniref:DUF4183 domain-containing protein n=1 Tax=Sporosarcina sp. JAI121 TaxID=2723064 RepID=UPI0015CC294B|nr:DUF4183 domain-containing protein [Sporosarcina sp. JAI121]NYF25675.1 hypothetical protein [Sporosarcina sp. JAI121]